MAGKVVSEKPMWQSKTLWFNLITFVIFLVPTVSGLNLIPVRDLTVINILGNAVLRFMTDQGVTVK